MLKKLEQILATAVLALALGFLLWLFYYRLFHQTDYYAWVDRFIAEHPIIAGFALVAALVLLVRDATGDVPNSTRTTARFRLGTYAVLVVLFIGFLAGEAMHVL